MKKMFCLLMLVSVTIYSQEQEVNVEPIATDRPDQTETPEIVPKGMFQMENGFSYEKINGLQSEIIVPSSLLKYGVNEKFELRLIAEYSKHESVDNKISGLKPILIGFKAKLAEEHGIIPKTSFIAHLMLPGFASEEIQATFYAPEFRFTMQHTLTDKLKFGYNLGAEWDGESPEPTFIYTLTMACDLTDKLGAFIESYGFVPQEDVADHRIDGGLTYLVSNNFMIDGSAGFGISEESPEYFASVGFSFRI